MLKVNCSLIIVQLYLQYNGTDNQNEIDEKYVDTVVYITNGIFLPLFIVLGTLLNLVNVWVLSRPRMRMANGIHIYLMGIVVSDICALLTQVPTAVRDMGQVSPEKRNTLAMHLAIIRTYPLMNIFKHTATWLMVAVAIIRCTAVCRPLQASSALSVRQARVIIAIIVALVTVIDSVRFLEHGVCTLNMGGNKVYLTSTTIFWEKYMQKIYPWINGTNFFLFPFTLIFAFSLILIYALWKARRARQLMSSEVMVSAEEKRVTILLLVIIITFFLLEFPEAYYMPYSSFTYNGDFMSQNKGRVPNSIVNALSSAHCTLNFVIYCALSHAYRQTFRDSFCRIGDSSYSGRTRATRGGSERTFSSRMLPRSSVSGSTRSPYNKSRTHRLSEDNILVMGTAGSDDIPLHHTIAAETNRNNVEQNHVVLE